MADTSYGTKIYRKAPGNELVIPSGCFLNREPTARITQNSTSLGSIANLATTYTTATVLTCSTSDVNVLAGIFNDLLTVSRNLGIIAT